MGRLGKAADAAALAAVSRIDMAHYRETGEVIFLSDVYAMAQKYASINSAFLQRRDICVAVTGISVDLPTQMVSVTVFADLSSLIPGILPYQGGYAITGMAQAHIIGK